MLDIGLGINGKLVHEEKPYPPSFFLLANCLNITLSLN